LEVDGDSAWNAVLWAVYRPYYELLIDFLTSVCFIDHNAKRVLRIGYQELRVIDPLWRATIAITPGPLPVVVIGAFGVNASDRIFAFEQDDPPWGTPLARFFPPADAQKLFARKLFKDGEVNCG
jgi:hypothetical protein